MIDRSDLLRRAGAGAAGLSLAQLLGPAARPGRRRRRRLPGTPALAVRLRQPRHARSAVRRHAVRRAGRRRARALHDAVDRLPARERQGDGQGAAVGDLAQGRRDRGLGDRRGRGRSGGGIGRAGGHPAGRLQRRLGLERPPVCVRGREPTCIGRQRRRRDRSARSHRHRRPVRAAAGEDLDGSGVSRGSSPGSRQRAGPPWPPWSGSRATPSKQQDAVEKAYARGRGIRGLFAVDGLGTLACGRAISHLGLRAKGVKGGGYDLLPDDLELVADGTLDFVVDQQPYVQGFAPVLQLFLARISQGVVVPWDTETSVLLRRSDVRMFLATKSRFEGSSSRQAYPLRRT